MTDVFDAIVVGAGPAGCSAAYSLAKERLEVLLVERGRSAGSKNMTGGVLYGAVLNGLIPDFWKEAPVERRIERHVISFLSGDSSFSLDFNKGVSEDPGAFSVLRARFDRWFADKVEEVGGIVATGLLADDLVRSEGRISGIVAGGDEILGQVVIAADGVNSTMARNAGLDVKLSPSNVNQGIKEVLQLPRDTIEDRFNLEGDGGAAIHFLGECTRGLHGGGFLYTNKESISLGVVVQLQALAQNGVKAVDLLEGFKTHPAVKEYVRGGTTLEYSAHLVPAGGVSMIPPLYTDGMLVAGDAAALVLATGRALEGINFAIASGMAAAQTVKQAREAGDYSKATLSTYERLLKETFVLQDLAEFRKAAGFLDNPRLYDTYPGLACAVAEGLFLSDGNPKKKAWSVLREEMKGKVSLWRLLRDAMAARGAM